uniref:Putative gag-pol polyprotein n=1 Tax=Boechera divaricarpa TaxID=115915 RepID=B2BXT9_9BRAS|nr:putative gag-pol polyprotein [Boechera divaricarpa]
MAPIPKLSLFTGTALDNPTKYRMALGSLQYLSLTRPDIAFAVNRLSQFLHRPTDVNWQAVKWILRYLATSPIMGSTSRSPHKRYFMPSSMPTGLKQRGVARSSTEAEYRAVANTASELCWICSLLSELYVTLPSTPVIYCDNVGATYLSANPVFHSRMKHIAIDYHFVRDNVQSGRLRVTHVSTHDQLADALTKPLPRPRFSQITSKLRVTIAPPA